MLWLPFLSLELPSSPWEIWGGERHFFFLCWPFQAILHTCFLKCSIEKHFQEMVYMMANHEKKKSHVKVRKPYLNAESLKRFHCLFPCE